MELEPADDTDDPSLELEGSSEAERVARWLFPASTKVSLVAPPPEEDPDDDFASPERHFFDARGSCDTRQVLPRTGRPAK